MHMGDALVSSGVACTMYTASAIAALWSAKKIKGEKNSENDDPIRLSPATAGVMGAFVFSAQMINFAVPGTGSSGHLCGGILLAAVLGPYQAFLTMGGILLLQCLVFADGGILAYGCNVWNMAFYSCFIGGVLWRMLMKRGMSRRKIMIYSMAAGVAVLQLGALSVAVQTYMSQVTTLPISVFLLSMQPIHLAIGIVEGLITSAVLLFVYENRPSLFYCPALDKSSEKMYSGGKRGGKRGGAAVVVIALSALFLEGIGALYASDKPDGLEWSVERTMSRAAGEETQPDGMLHRFAGKVQETISLLPDYGWKNGQSGGTGVAGVTGTVVMFLIGASGCLLLTQRKGKKDVHG